LSLGEICLHGLGNARKVSAADGKQAEPKGEAPMLLVGDEC
jgi:hypothetical protein